MDRPIANSELRDELLPPGDAAWDVIKAFARSYDAYRQYGDNQALGALANGKAQEPRCCTLSELRAALFYEYRQFNHFGYDPDANAMLHIRALVEEIRERLGVGEHL
jgi:hypothetical protein